MAVNIIATASTPEESTVIGIKTVTLNDAQIKSLPDATGIEVIPAIVGKAIVVLSAFLVRDATAGAYTNIHTDATLLLTYGDYDAEASSLVTMDFFGADKRVDCLAPPLFADSRETYAGFLVSGSLESTNVINKPVKLFALNGQAGDWTGGNSANTMRITVYYVIVDL